MDFYKDKLKTEFKVGIFTIAGILILIFSYTWLTEIIESNKYTEIQVSFENAGNIEKGSDVTILGVKSGRVGDIRIDKFQVILTLKVLLEDSLYEGSEFTINEVDLMGDVQVEIKPGISEVPLDLMQIHPGNIKYGMSTLISELSGVVLDLKKVLAVIGDEDGIISDARSIMDTSLEFVTELRVSYENNSENFDKLILKSAEVAEQLSVIIDQNDEHINEGFKSIVQVVEEIKVTLQELDETSKSIRRLSEKVSNENSTVNRLISEDDLYLDLHKTITKMDSLLQDIQENPKKYFKFSVF